MAVFYSTFSSECMKMTMGVTTVIPQKKNIRSEESPKIKKGSFNNNYPLLILLHDEASSPGEILRMTSLERWATKQEVIVVLPEGMLGFYTDYYARDPGYPIPGVQYSNPEIEAKFTEMRFETFIVKEVLEYVRNVFPVSEEQNKAFIGGIGMGGFGALKIALRYNDIFSKAFTINGYLDINWMWDHMPGRKEQFEAVFGNENRGKEKGELDLKSQIESCGKSIPEIYQIWRKNHISNEMNQRFVSAAKECGKLKVESDECGEGFAYVDKKLASALTWI